MLKKPEVAIPEQLSKDSVSAILRVLISFSRLWPHSYNLAALAPDITYTFKVNKTKGKVVMPVNERLHVSPYYHAAASFPEVPFLPTDSSVYLFSHNWVMWPLLIAKRETGKRVSIWLFSLDDDMAREKGVQNGF